MTMAQVVRAEAHKAASLRTPVVTVAATVVLVLSLTWALTWAAAQAARTGNTADVGALNPQAALTFVLHYAQLGVILFAAWLVVQEQDEGSLRTSLLSTPVREVFLSAKVAVSAAGSLLMAVLAVPAAFLIRSSVEHHFSTASGDADVVRAAAGYIAYWTLLGVITTCLAFMVRGGIVAAGVMASLVLVVSPLLLSRTPWVRFLPDQLGAQLYQSGPASSTDLGPLLGLVALLGWALVVAAGGVGSLRSWAART